MLEMSKFISCDWGTSSFRLRLVDASAQAVLAQVKSNRGIAEAHTQWRQQGLDEEKRFSFYQSIIQDHLQQLHEQVDHSLHDLPLIISGMASSNIGMVELPYKALPFGVDGSDLVVKKIKATGNFRHDVVVISGAKSTRDVMRGEEVQLIGCDFPSNEERIYILPGTHSKHVTVKHQRVTDFKTYMTGEFFYLLSHYSILSKSVEQESRGDELKSFEEGVAQSVHDHLLHNAFLVRTNHLFGSYSKEENHHYLSGLLIGAELKELAGDAVPVTVVANESMQKYYVAALKKLGCRHVETIDVDIALVNGHCKMYDMIKSSQSSSASN